MRLGAHACRRYRLSVESNQGSARLRGPRSLGKKGVSHFLLSYLRHDVQFHDVGSHHDGGVMSHRDKRAEECYSWLLVEGRAEF